MVCHGTVSFRQIVRSEAENNLKKKSSTAMVKGGSIADDIPTGIQGLVRL
jgi:hypothetical protein